MRIRYVVGGAIVVALGSIIPVQYTSAEDSPERQITLVGCVMREADFRDTYGPGRSGPRGPGIGLRNEYMLVDAHEVTPGTTPTAETGSCAEPRASFPYVYELTGSREGELAAYVGKRVELTGIQKEADTKPVGTSGTFRPTGGFDALGHELHLFEVEVASVNDVSAAGAVAIAAERVETPAPEVKAEAEVAAEAPAPAPAPAPETAVVVEATPPEAPPAPETQVAEKPAEAPAPQVQAPAPAPQPARPAAPQPERQTAQRQLPRTASPIPLAGLIGLLSLAAAAGVRVARHRR